VWCAQIGVEVAQFVSEKAASFRGVTSSWRFSNVGQWHWAKVQRPADYNYAEAAGWKQGANELSSWATKLVIGGKKTN